MIHRNTETEDGIEFLSGRKARFRFECKACGRCCGEYAIMLSPYDIIRLKRATGRTTGDLVRRGTIKIERVPFKRAFGFGPVADMLDVFGVSQTDTVPVAFMGFKKDFSGTSVCEFLSPEKDGKRLCGIYEHRPGMCRLHPVGCVTIGGRRKWMYRRPLCDVNEAPERTVEEWLKISRMRPFLQANGRYLRWMRELLEQCERFPAVTGHQWRALERILYDFDPIDPHIKRINMDTIDKMFHEWLSHVKPAKRRGG